MRTEGSKCYARAGLLGNPSDGYHGKAISFSIKNYLAEVKLTEADRLEFAADPGEPIIFKSLDEFAQVDFPANNEGANRLLIAGLKRVLDHCFSNTDSSRSTGRDSNFTATKKAGLFKAKFSSNIPRQVGMAGSSAIVIAAMKSYLKWFGVSVSPELLASMALAAEHDLGISAGLQDRVIQAMEGLVFMDFDASMMRTERGLELGKYERLNPSLLHSIYVAFANSLPESTDVLHSDLKQKYDSGDVQVVAAISEIAKFAESGRQAIVDGDFEQLDRLIDRNFDLRQSICVLNPGHVRMIETARDCGASAKYCGSGGAIVGTIEGEHAFANLRARMQAIDCEVFRPEII